MHKTERWVLFPYLAMDYKAAEDWLNQQPGNSMTVVSAKLLKPEMRSCFRRTVC